MSLIQPGYRAVVYKPRRDDKAENVPLVARDSSDKFLITTLPSFTDATGSWAPYLEQVRGRRGVIDPLTKGVDTGRIDLTVNDVRTTAGGANANRWLTQFFGDSDNLIQLAGSKIYIQETLDGGSTWNSYFTGRITSPGLNTKIKTTITCRDMAGDFKNIRIFDGPPHESASYAKIANLVPVGLPVDFGGISARPPILVHPEQPIGGITILDWSDKLIVETGYPGYQTTDDIMTNHFPGIARGGGFSFVVPENKEIRVFLTPTSGPNSGSTGEFFLSKATGYPEPEGTPGSTGLPKLQNFTVKGLGLALPRPLTFSFLKRGTQFECRIQLIRSTEARLIREDKKPIPIVISDIPVVTVLDDILQGFFGASFDSGFDEPTFLLPTGSQNSDPMFPIPYNSASLQALEAVVTINWLQGFAQEHVRAIVKEGGTFFEWVQENILNPFGWMAWLDEDGLFTVADLKPDVRIESQLATTITNDDLIVGNAYTQIFAGNESITSFEQTYFQDRYFPDQVAIGDFADQIDDIDPTLITSTVFSLTQLNIRALEFGNRKKAFNSVFMRYWAAPDGDDESSPDNHFIVRHVKRKANDLLDIYQASPMYHNLVVTRNDNTQLAKIGTYVRLTIDEMLNPFTNTRGGSRFGIVIERTENGPTMVLKVLDLEEEEISIPPLAGSVVIDPSGSIHSIRVGPVSSSVTSNIEIQTALTLQSEGTRPAESSSWTERHRSTFHAEQSRVIDINPIPSGLRVWAKVRATNAHLFQPSTWVFPTNNFVDMPTLPQPGIITSSLITGGTTTLTWTNPVSASLGVVEIKLDAAVSASADLQRVAIFNTIATSYELVGLDPSTAYTAGIRYIDSGDLGGFGPFRVKEWTTSGSLNTCPVTADFIAL